MLRAAARSNRLSLPFGRRAARTLAVRACTQERFTILMQRGEYMPGTMGSGPPGTTEVAWYESDNCFGCVVNSEPLNSRGTYDYFYMLLPKLDGNMRKVSPDNGMPELEDYEGGFAEPTAAAAALKGRLEEFEDYPYM